MDTRAKSPSTTTFRAGAFQRRLALIFGLQLLAVAIAVLMGIYDVAPLGAVLALIAIISVLAWLAARREWRPVSTLAGVLKRWNEQRPDLDSLQPERLSRRTDADVAALARGLHGFATRIADYNLRERNFTRDASHELRSPLTVIKMSTDMLGDETALSDFGNRSVQRIKRAAREMEAVVEALLILARESERTGTEEHFVVNDLLHSLIDEVRQVLDGRPVELWLDESARFALHAPPRVFAVLCWQLIRNACQQAEGGRVVITVLPGMVTVANQAAASTALAEQHPGFELAIAQRISERFAWPLELPAGEGGERVAKVRFPEPLPA
ncbi:histidine kinase [Frateuria sp. Soil773]|uniref:sensor histidine kinase n=1 Tax=Frateuria sp. Soil773 TaxID=1736407 RepID=UPI0006FAB496|nr:HAMP domain-containing sensor histidine kinase [Frateuria sp. Soil773]KRE88537.1 histidine kinase [Frateuria sp. Soil773]